MENNCNVMHLFEVKLAHYLTDISETCVLLNKQKEKFRTLGDFSFITKMKCWEKYFHDSDKEDLEKTFTPSSVKDLNIDTILEYCYLIRLKEFPKRQSDAFEWVLENMVERSKSWPLHISKCLFEGDRIQVYLDKSYTFRCILQIILTQKLEYGRLLAKQQMVCVTSDKLQEDRNKMDLSEFRVDLLRCTIINFLRAVGYEVVDKNECPEMESSICLHLTTKSTAQIAPGFQRIICGVVTNSSHHSKEITVTAQDYLRQRCDDMKIMAEHKYECVVQQESQWKDLLFQLGDAAVKMDLLQIKPSHTVCLSFGKAGNGSRKRTHKGAAFVLYNCARLATILSQFEEKVHLGYYPCLIPFEEVDFSLLSKEEEWDLMFSYLLSYPSVLQSSVLNVDQGKVGPNLLCNFIITLCSSFSVYYRRVRILTEPRSQLLPIMFARIYLLKGIQQVLHNALSLLDISPVLRM